VKDRREQQASEHRDCRHRPQGRDADQEDEGCPEGEDQAAPALGRDVIDPNALVRHLGRGPFLALGPAFERTLVGAAALLVVWLILRWMYRRRIFIRI